MLKKQVSIMQLSRWICNGLKACNMKRPSKSVIICTMSNCGDKRQLLCLWPSDDYSLAMKAVYNVMYKLRFCTSCNSLKDPVQVATCTTSIYSCNLYNIGCTSCKDMY